MKNIEFCSSAQEAARGVKAIVILTEWAEFKKINYAKLDVSQRLIMDFRNILRRNPPKGYEYICLGKR